MSDWLQETGKRLKNADKKVRDVFGKEIKPQDLGSTKKWELLSKKVYVDKEEKKAVSGLDFVIFPGATYVLGEINALPQDEQKNALKKEYKRAQKEYYFNFTKNPAAKNYQQQALRDYLTVGHGATETRWQQVNFADLSPEDQNIVTSRAIMHMQSDNIGELRSQGKLIKIDINSQEYRQGYEQWKQDHPEIAQRLREYYRYTPEEIEKYYQDYYFAEQLKSVQVKDAQLQKKIDDVIKGYTHMNRYLGIDFDLQEYVQELQERLAAGEEIMDAEILRKLFVQTDRIIPANRNLRWYFAIDNDVNDIVATDAESLDDQAIRAMIVKKFWQNNAGMYENAFKDATPEKIQQYIQYLHTWTVAGAKFTEKELQVLNQMKKLLDLTIEKEVSKIKKEILKISNREIKQQALVKCIDVLKQYLNATTLLHENFLQDFEVGETGLKYNEQNKEFQIDGTIDGSPVTLFFNLNWEVFIQDSIHRNRGIWEEEERFTINDSKCKERLPGRFPNILEFFTQAQEQMDEALHTCSSVTDYTKILSQKLQGLQYPTDYLFAKDALQQHIHKNLIYQDVLHTTGFPWQNVDKVASPQWYEFFESIDVSLDKLSTQELLLLRNEINIFINHLNDWKRNELSQDHASLLRKLFHEEKLQDDAKNIGRDEYPNSWRTFRGTIIVGRDNNIGPYIDIARLQHINAQMEKNLPIGTSENSRYRESMRIIESYYQSKDTKEAEELLK